MILKKILKFYKNHPVHNQCQELNIFQITILIRKSFPPSKDHFFFCLSLEKKYCASISFQIFIIFF